MSLLSPSNPFHSSNLTDKSSRKKQGCVAMKILPFILLFLFGLTHGSEDDSVKYASPCEVCKIVTRELEERLRETGKSHDIIETGYNIEAKKSKTKYKASELRLVESLDGLCERMLDYRIHKERTDSSRFDKSMSQTFKTLHGLVEKGVKVDLGIPFELWDKPPAEVTHLKTQCESLLEEHEETIEKWYASHQETESLNTYLCRKHVLPKKQQKCLDEKGETEAKPRNEL